MPTYEYLCQTCSHRFETWQKMTDNPLTACPECGSSIRRVLYPASVVFKGSGFYKTDHASTSAVASETNGDGKKTEGVDSKKAEGTNGNAASSHGESKSSSETSTASTASSSNNTSSSGSKSTAPAGTK